MTVMDLANRFDLQPKDVTDYIQFHATFPVRTNFQTGELIIPDDIDVEQFIAPLIQRKQEKSNQLLERQAQRETEKIERRAQQEKEAAEIIAREKKHQVELRLLQENQLQQYVEQQNSFVIEKRKSEGAEGYYQYKVISLMDENGGSINPYTLESNLNELGIEGWHLVAAYSNELGHNTNPGLLGSTNATIDQNILILERFVKF